MDIMNVDWVITTRRIWKCCNALYVTVVRTGLTSSGFTVQNARKQVR